MAGEGPTGADRGELPDIGRLVTARLGEYVELWAGAAGKMAEGTYRSDDLLDDWFRFWGNVTRDATAGATVAWRTGQASARARRGRPAREA